VENPDIKPQTVISALIHTCIVNKLQSFLENKLAELDMVVPEDNAAMKEERPKVQDFANSNE
jgi:hypothetical protein